MLRRIVIALFGMLLLSACGRGSEDFTVKIARPSSRVAVALGQSGLDGQLSGLFPGIRIDRSQPAKGQVLYTIPGNGKFPAAVRFSFEDADGGKATVVHAAIDVPAVTVQMKGKTKYVSEYRVERAIKGIVEGIGSKLEENGDTSSERARFSQLLTVLAIITDSRQLERALDMDSHPEWYTSGLDWLGGNKDDRDDYYPDRPYGDPARPDDPNLGAQRSEYKEREQARAASAPMDAAQGAEAEGDEARGEAPRADNPDPGY